MEASESQRRSRLIDLRFVVDLVLARYYVVLLVGQDQRSKNRKVGGINRMTHIAVAVVLLIGLNLLMTSILLLFAYLLKSAVGINLFPGHLGQC